MIIVEFRFACIYIIVSLKSYIQVLLVRHPVLMLGSLQPNNHPQQNQQQQQQPQQQHQAQQGQIPPPPPQNGQDFTLSSVLHYLQTEWRRYERDRNEWEIERAEMRVRLSLVLIVRFF